MGEILLVASRSASPFSYSRIRPIPTNFVAIDRSANIPHVSAVPGYQGRPSHQGVHCSCWWYCSIPQGCCRLLAPRRHYFSTERRAFLDELPSGSAARTDLFYSDVWLLPPRHREGSQLLPLQFNLTHPAHRTAQHCFTGYEPEFGVGTVPVPIFVAVSGSGCRLLRCQISSNDSNPGPSTDAV